MAGLFLSTILAGAVLAGGTQLTHEGKLLFESEAKVSFGATYASRAIKATVNAKEAAKISVCTDKKPVRIFLGTDEVPAEKWTYVEKGGMTTLTVPAGMSSIQFRFDDMASLKPYAAQRPLFVRFPNDKNILFNLKGECADEHFTGKFSWPEEETGIYEVDFPKGVTLKANNAPVISEEDGKATYYMRSGSALQVDAEAPSGKVPGFKIHAKCTGQASQVKAMDRVALLERKDAVKMEGEAFTREIGGQVSISKEHKNTSGGGCVFNWGTTGDRLEWDFEVAEAGMYHVVFVYACQEANSLRKYMVNGRLVEQASLVDFPSTGGWGRSNPREWQAVEAAAAGKPVLVKLQAGKNTVALENFCGQHMNMDCIVVFPAK